MSLKREFRLTSSRDFAEVRQKGLRISCGPFVFNAWVRGVSTTRLAVIVSRRVGNAVVRNRVKRRLREIARRYRGMLPEGTDGVLIARSSILQFEFADLCARFEKATRNVTRLSMASDLPPAPSSSPVSHG